MLDSHQMQHTASLNVVVLGSLVIIHLLTSKDQPAAATAQQEAAHST
jgi:hypothetical protein